MKDDLEHRAEAVVPVISRRNFIGAAAAAGVASIVPAGLGSLSSKGSAMKVEQFVLPTATKDVTPFKIHVPQAALDDLKKKLADARWPDKETVADWSQGVPLARAQALVEYWRTRYDWRRVESTLNGLPQFRTQIDGLGIYFIHVRSKHENALPIILTHGWPGSIIEFLQVIGPLTDPTAHGGKADGAPRLQPLRRTRRRLGRGSDELDGEAAGAEACRDSSEPSNSLSPATTTARWVYSGRTSGAGAARKVWERRFWLCVDPGDASPNTRVRSCRLTDWASDVDLRKVSGMERQQG